MKHLARSILSGWILMLLLMSVQAGDQLEIGATMPKPNRKMKNVDGKQLSVADIKGKKGTVVAFWCNHCPYVIKYRSRFIELAKKYKDSGFGFITVNANDPEVYAGDNFEKMQEMAKRFSYPFPFVVDVGSVLAEAYGASRTPHIFLFDENDKLVYVGAIDDSTQPEKVKETYLADALDALLAGKPVPNASTRAFGCSIKWYKD